MEQLFGHDKRIQTVLELSSDSCGSHRTATESGCVTGDKESLLRNVVERSKETGTWISDIAPETAYTILGITYNADHEPCVVLKQPYIKAIRYATDEEIDAFLEDKGYTVDMDDIWFDGQYEISDVKSSNVLVDDHGNLHFIDAVVNDIRISVAQINKVSIKHPEKRTT